MSAANISASSERHGKLQSPVKKKKESLVKVATLLRVGMQSAAPADASHDTLSHFMIIWVRPH